MNTIVVTWMDDVKQVYVVARWNVTEGYLNLFVENTPSVGDRSVKSIPLCNVREWQLNK